MIEIPVVAAVLATTAAGVALVRLRRRSDSVIAPLLVHFALNAAGTAATWVALRYLLVPRLAGRGLSILLCVFGCPLFLERLARLLRGTRWD